MDNIVKALLLRLAEELDASALSPLADRLEELGDERAVSVREVLAWPMYTTQGGVIVPTAEHDCRAVLTLFPEGPHWQTDYSWPGPGHRLSGGNAYRTLLDATAQRDHLEEIGYRVTVSSPFWNPALTPPPSHP